MLDFFRTFMKSKVGVALTLAFLVLLAFAFASSDILSFGTPGNAGNSTKVASAGSRTITASSLDFFARRALEQAREQDPRQNMRTLVAGGGLEQVLDGLLDNASISEFGRKVGILAGNRLVGSELAKEPGFRGNTGNFDDNTYRAVIGQKGFTDQTYRQLIADQLVSQQIQIPASFGARVPAEMVNRYAALLSETRVGSIALLPAAVFAPKAVPSESALSQFYAAHKSNYIRPERRSIRYLVFDDTALKSVPAPTEAEIAASYNTNKARYAASETRKLTQLVVPTEAAARAILGEVSSGKSLEESARVKKLATAAIGPITGDAYASQNSGTVSAAVFAGAQGRLVGPVKGGLGWYIVRIDAVERKAGKTLDQARAEIVTELTAQKKRAAFADFSARIESEFDDGAALADIAKELAEQVRQTEPLTADGKVYGKPEQAAPPELARVIQTAFLMEQEGQPQLAEVVPGKTYVAFDVTGLQASEAAPLAEIRETVIADYQLDQGATAAKAAAARVEAQARKGVELASGMAAIGAALPPVDAVNMKRSELQQYGQVPPPPLMLLFSMAQGTVKTLPAPGNRGWYVVSLKTITPGKIDPRDPMLSQARGELGALAGREYAEQLRKAIRKEVGASSDAAAIKKLGQQMVGSN